MSTLNEQRIEVATNFVESHRCCEEWKERLYNDDDYLTVYHNILGGVFGDCEEYDKDEADGEHRIEISGHESLSGNPVLFDFYPIFDNNAIKKLEKSW